REYRGIFQEWRATEEKREELASAGRLSEEERQFYRNEIEKIDPCQVSEDSIAELERAFNRISRGQESMENARALAEGLVGDDGVFYKIGAMQRLAAELEEADPSTAGLRERLQALTVEVEDLGREFEG